MRSMANGSLGLAAGASPTARLWAAPCTALVRETSDTKSAFAERTVATPTLRLTETTRPPAPLTAAFAESTDAPRSRSTT